MKERKIFAVTIHDNKCVGAKDVTDLYHQHVNDNEVVLSKFVAQVEAFKKQFGFDGIVYTTSREEAIEKANWLFS